MSAYQVSGRRGKGMIGAGLAAVVLGFAVQAYNVQSVAGQAPPQLGSSPGFGDVALLAEIAWLLIVGGVIVTIIGVVRYAQSEPRAAAGTPTRALGAPAFCASCGAGIVGDGRFCASCGAATAR